METTSNANSTRMASHRAHLIHTARRVISLVVALALPTSALISLFYAQPLLYHVDLSRNLSSLSIQVSQNVGRCLVGFFCYAINALQSVGVVEHLLVHIQHFLSRHAELLYRYGNILHQHHHGSTTSY
jgi:predicted DNA repair protein MutK